MTIFDDSSTDYYIDLGKVWNEENFKWFKEKKLENYMGLEYLSLIKCDNREEFLGFELENIYDLISKYARKEEKFSCKDLDDICNRLDMFQRIIQDGIIPIGQESSIPGRIQAAEKDANYLKELQQKEDKMKCIADLNYYQINIKSFEKRSTILAGVLRLISLN
jgi:hypothetical protein